MLPCLLVAATRLEAKPLITELNLESYSDADSGARFYGGARGIDLLITGVGQLQTAYHVGLALHAKRYGIAVNFGIAGSFNENLGKGVVVEVVQEELADLGAEHDSACLDLFDLGLLGRSTPPFRNGALHASSVSLHCIEDLPKVRSITVNRVLGSHESVELMRRRYHPDVVNMEGGAFLYACSLSRVPALELRSISDYVGPRDKSTWDIPGAVHAVGRRVSQVLAELCSQSPTV